MIDPYLTPSGVLRNRLGIADPDLLAQAEADISRAALLLLAERPVPGAYDLRHLQDIHVAIFGAVYPWAGELRTVEISKQTPFCPSVNLVSFATKSSGDWRPPTSCAGSPEGTSSMRLLTSTAT